MYFLDKEAQGLVGGQEGGWRERGEELEEIQRERVLDLECFLDILILYRSQYIYLFLNKHFKNIKLKL